MDQRHAVQKIIKRGILLVFPIRNAKEPYSLWAEFHPRTKMRWEWNENGDDKVGELWYLMKKLSISRKVIYSKWYQNRATFFSKPLFTALLTISRNQGHLTAGLSRQAREILDLLESDSPLSTKQIKKLTALQGRDNEPVFQRAMKELFSRFLIVAYGEVEDGAFPSLAVGATKLIFEELWESSQKLSPEDAQTIVNKLMPLQSKTRIYFNKTLQKLIADKLRYNSDNSTKERSPGHVT